jgi:hypothetical protein
MGTSLLLAFPKSGVTSTFVVELCCDQPVIIYVSNNFGNFPPKRTEVRALVTLSPYRRPGPSLLKIPDLSFQPLR